MTLRISDHAVLRYLERTGIVDVAAVRADLKRRAARCAAAADAIGVVGIYAIRIDGVRLVVDGASDTVVTAVPDRKRRGGGRDR